MDQSLLPNSAVSVGAVRFGNDLPLALTWTVGGVMGGNWATGSKGTQMAPARVMTMAITEAKMGRLMKKLTNMKSPSPALNSLSF